MLFEGAAQYEQDCGGKRGNADDRLDQARVHGRGYDDRRHGVRAADNGRIRGAGERGEQQHEERGQQEHTGQRPFEGGAAAGVRVAERGLRLSGKKLRRAETGDDLRVALAVLAGGGENFGQVAQNFGLLAAGQYERAFYTADVGLSVHGLSSGSIKRFTHAA